MARTNKPANGGSDSPKPARRPARKGNGSPAGLKNPDAVARRAYEIYQGRGGSHGADLDDWFEAERQLKHGLTGPAPAKPRRRKSSERTGP